MTTEPVFVSARKALRVLSTSEAKTFRRCPRKHHYAYRLRRRPWERAATLRFGTLFHIGLETWWKTASLEKAIGAMREAVAKGREPADPYDLAKAEALMVGYDARWIAEPIEVLAVEQEFEIDLVNPATNHTSKTFRIGGKMDAIARIPNLGILVIEHKSSAEDITAGSDYWRKLRLDAQVSTYIAAGKALGFDIVGCLYDVIGKPRLKPQLATPVEDRKYTQEKSKACPECKKKNAEPAPHTIDGLTCTDGRIVTDPGGKLYANMRETAETPDEYRGRILKDIKESPDAYFSRGTPIVRIGSEEDDAAFDLWATARAMREAEYANRYPRHVEACFDFHRPCEFFAVCCGEADINNDALFRTAPRAHEELSGGGDGGGEKEGEAA